MSDNPIIKAPAPNISSVSLKSRNPKRLYISVLSTFLLIGVIGTGSWYYWTSSKNIEETPQASTSSARPNAGSRRNAPLAPVRTVTVSQQDMPYIITALGTITPKQQVILTSRVNGELLKEHFAEGQYVQQGDLLFTLDRESYQIAVTQAQGQLLKDQANLANAQADVLRFQNLTAQRAISDQELMTQKALVKQLEGALKSSQAALDNAELQLSYTEIKAPISGKLGLKQSSIGNYIQANNTPLISITQTSPIDVRFAIPESQIAPLMRAMQNSQNQNLTVDLWDRSYQEKLAVAKLLSVDNQIDTTTGTVTLKAELENSQSELFPNQFVNTQLHLSTLENAIVIPINALQLGAEGEFVWRVIPKKPKETATDQSNAEKPVRGSRTPKEQTPNATNSVQWQVEKVNVKTSIRDEQFIVIESGLNLGDKIVTDGVDRLSEGASVDIVEASNTSKSNEKNLQENSNSTGDNSKNTQGDNKRKQSTEIKEKTNTEKSATSDSKAQTNQQKG